jgi:hypothetical protein
MAIFNQYRLLVTTNTAPSAGYSEGEWAKTSLTKYSINVRWGTYYGTLEASKAGAAAWELLTTGAKIKILEELLPTRWETEDETDADEDFITDKISQMLKGIIGSDDATPTPAAAGWTCSCGTVSKGKFCPKCGQKRPDPAPTWKCPDCGNTNPGTAEFCPECGQKRPAPPEKSIAEMTASEFAALIAKIGGKAGN